VATIGGYSFGRIVVDGQEETRDLIVLPDRVFRNWWRRNGHGLVLDDLAEVIDELPKTLIIGTGALRQAHPGYAGAGAAPRSRYPRRSAYNRRRHQPLPPTRPKPHRSRLHLTC
jgi:hypothetical protein